MIEENPLQQLWLLRQYLSRMRDLQTVFVRFDGMRGPECVEFGFTQGYSLGGAFAELRYKPATAMQMADMGIDPMTRGTVYAYIERRAPAFVDKHYGWGVER